MEKTAGGSYDMWNFLDRIRKYIEDQQKKSHSLGLSFIGLRIYKGFFTLS